MARSMMLGAGLPKRCWGHDMMHAAYIDEFLGTSANSTDSPHSLWYGAHEDPDFKVFGSRGKAAGCWCMQAATRQPSQKSWWP